MTGVQTTPPGATTPEDYRHAWDRMPHTIWAAVPVEDVKLGDHLAGGALCVTGIASAEHRGKTAIRLDVENMDSGGRGRVVLTAGQRIGDVKRYEESPVGTIPRTPGSPNRATVQERMDAGEIGVGATIGTAGMEAMILTAARLWARSDDGLENDEQKLFAFLCHGIEVYSRLALVVGPNDAPEEEQLHLENSYTLRSIAENVCPGYDIVS